MAEVLEALLATHSSDLELGVVEMTKLQFCGMSRNMKIMVPRIRILFLYFDFDEQTIMIREIF